MRTPRHAMKAAAALLLIAGPSWAQINCTLTMPDCTTDCASMSVSFEIDASQFVAPQNPNDPPRRQITTVDMDGARFVAQAIMLPGGVRGFHEEAGALGSRLLIVQPDGTARLSLQPQNQTWLGACTSSE